VSTHRLQDVRDADTWNHFVEQEPTATCFHLYGWRSALEDALGYKTRYMGAFDGDRLIAIHPQALVRSRLFGTAAVSLPFCSYGGPAGANLEALALLQKDAVLSARVQGAAYLETRSLQTTATTHSVSDTYFSFRKAIPAGDANLSFLPSKRRNMVRKAINAGLQWRVEQDIDRFFHLYAENARAHGTPALPKKFFSRLSAALGSSSDILFVFDAQGQAISAIMSFYDKGVVHAGFAGELPAARGLAANDFKYWSLYQHATMRGCTTFDLGRSKINTGSYEFKKLWGLTPSPVTHGYELFTRESPPANNPNNPKFSMAIKVWSRLPRIIVDRIGPLVIHGLG
jgi:FemAB-related protein (PEP-CTERM system-associated)